MIIRVRLSSGEVVNIPAREVIEVREKADGTGNGVILTRSGPRYDVTAVKAVLARLQEYHRREPEYTKPRSLFGAIFGGD